MDTSSLYCLRGSVTTGLEHAALEEATEKMPAFEPQEGKGYISWKQTLDTSTEALKLRTVDHLHVVMSKFHIEWKADAKECLDQLGELLRQVDWRSGLDVWSRFSHFPHRVSADKLAEGEPHPCPENLPRYRATCNRTGDKHPFGSPEVAHHLGGLINDDFGWHVSLKDYHVEVVIGIVENEVTFSLALTREGLFLRNIKHFARTTLRGTICAGLLRFAEIKPGDVVCDPMCGTGAISIEGAIEHPDTFHIAADNNEYCVQCARDNILDLNAERIQQSLNALSAAVVQWDATQTPLVNACVDVIVSDLPFGRKQGNKTDNRKLYPAFLTEAARISRPSSGRAVLLTADRNCMYKALPAVRQWWSVPRTHIINHGGLRACAYILKRTPKIW